MPTVHASCCCIVACQQALLKEASIVKAEVARQKEAVRHLWGKQGLEGFQGALTTDTCVSSDSKFSCINKALQDDDTSLGQHSRSPQHLQVTSHVKHEEGNLPSHWWWTACAAQGGRSGLARHAQSGGTLFCSGGSDDHTQSPGSAVAVNDLQQCHTDKQSVTHAIILMFQTRHILPNAACRRNTCEQTSGSKCNQPSPILRASWE